MPYSINLRFQTRGQIAILLCAVCWSTSGLFIKLLDWHPVVIAGGRSLIAAFFMLAIRRFFPRDRYGGAEKKDRLLVFAAGFCYAATMITFVIANKLTASANAILLQYSAPVWAGLLAWLFIKEKPRWEQWIALVLAIAGMILFFREGLTSGSIVGDSIAVVSGVLFGANSVFMRAQKNPADSMLASHILTAFFAFPFFFLFPPHTEASSLAAIGFMGVIQLGCASLLFSYGIKRVTALQAMLTASIEPVLNPLWVFFLTGEKPSFSALLGGALIIIAAASSSIINSSWKKLKK
jgi:drug/metabolite transporter (DMT)-like permease